LCLAANIFWQAEALAYDKKASLALSHYIVAGVYEHLGQIEDAIREYKKALAIERNNAAIHLSLAVSYVKNNEIKKAIEEAKLAAGLSQAQVEPHAILALLYSLQGNTESASVEYELALENASKLHPDNIGIYKRLGVVYLAQKKYREAERVFRVIADLSATDPEAHFYLALLADESQNEEEAIKELKKVLGIDPDYHQALNYLGYLYVQKGINLDEAGLMIRRALEKEPFNGAYLDSLGWLYFKQGRLKEAAQELKRASRLLENPLIYEHLGDVYYKMNDTENARLNWQNSLRLDASQGGVKDKIEGLELNSGSAVN